MQSAEVPQGQIPFGDDLMAHLFHMPGYGSMRISMKTVGTVCLVLKYLMRPEMIRPSCRLPINPLKEILLPHRKYTETEVSTQDAQETFKS